MKFAMNGFNYSKGFCHEGFCVSEPVCSSKLIVYPNICEFKYLQCVYDILDEEILPSMAECEGKGKCRLTNALVD